MRILARRNLLYLSAAICLIGVGYGAAVLQMKRAAIVERAMTATAELWNSYELLQALEGGDAKTTLNGMALKADHLVAEIAEAKDEALNEDQREWRTKVLTKYKSFRDAHPAFFVLPSQMDAQAKEDMGRTQEAVAEFLKKAAK